MLKDNGLILLSNCISDIECDELRILGLRENEITDIGIVCLGESLLSIKCKRLNYISLCKNYISIHGINAFE